EECGHRDHQCDHPPCHPGPGHGGPRREDRGDHESHHDELGHDQIDGVGADEEVSLVPVEAEAAVIAVVTHSQPAAEHGTAAAQRAAAPERTGQHAPCAGTSDIVHG